MSNWRKQRIVYCWDTSVFFAWLKGEACHPLQDIDYVVEQISNDDASLLIPMTTYEELNYTRLTDGQKSLFDRMTQRSNVMLVDLSPPIARKSAEIMRLSEEEGFTTKLNDARIAATATVMQATVLHSLNTDHLRLNRKELVDGLSITKPHLWDGQLGVDYGEK